MKRGSRPSCEDVLDAFAVESEIGRATLERYLREFPEYAEDIVDLAAELSREPVVREEPLSEREHALIAAAWKSHVKAAPKPVADPFAVFSTTKLRALAQSLEVPLQVLTAFRDRAVLAGSVPKRFLRQLASAMDSKLDSLIAYLRAPEPLNLARSYKANAKPKSGGQVTFRQLLMDAGVPEEKCKRLMVDD